MMARWEELFNEIKSGASCCTAKDLTMTTGKEMSVMKILQYYSDQ